MLEVARIAVKVFIGAIAIATGAVLIKKGIEDAQPNQRSKNA